MAKYMLRAYALEDPSPQSVLTRLNRALYSEMSDECMFITMFYGIVDTAAGTLTYTNAGHPPPLLYRGASGEMTELRSVPPPDHDPQIPTDGMVGAINDMRFTESVVPLEPGSVLALFTDGVTEARTEVKMFESEGVQDVIREHAGESAEQIVAAIYDRAVEFASGVLRDDVAIVVAKNG
jgi:serine phosphatase RsbU (regulator of sigma subunit)